MDAARALEAIDSVGQYLKEHATERFLQDAASCEDEVSFTDATELAQVISGTAFIGLSMWLIFANTSRITCAQKATYEQRLTVCVAINIAVSLFSGFFNILQLTSIDNFVLPRGSSFVLDLSRPIEWVVTCPIMQLALVLMGGSRIPSYRRFMMPLLSVAVLLCGTASMFSESPVRFAWYGFGLTLAMIMFYHNIVQVGENSDGTESFFRGSSDFRFLSLYVIFTWFPFPIWFAFSPEGFGVVQDIIVIHMGWVVLNIISKFGFVIYLQQVKTTYCNKLRATRELYGVEPGGFQGEDPLKDKSISLDRIAVIGGGGNGLRGLNNSDSTKSLQDPEKFMTLVAEAMSSLGMREHTERFQKLLVQARVTSIEMINALTEAECVDLQLPYNLISAVQKRYRNEQMEKVEMIHDFPRSYVDADGFSKEKMGNYSMSPEKMGNYSMNPTNQALGNMNRVVDGHVPMPGQLQAPNFGAMQIHSAMEIDSVSMHRMEKIEEKLSLLLNRFDEQRDQFAVQSEQVVAQITNQVKSHLTNQVTSQVTQQVTSQVTQQVNNQLASHGSQGTERLTEQFEQVAQVTNRMTNQLASHISEEAEKQREHITAQFASQSMKWEAHFAAQNNNMMLTQQADLGRSLSELADKKAARAEQVMSQAVNEAAQAASQAASQAVTNAVRNQLNEYSASNRDMHREGISQVRELTEKGFQLHREGVSQVAAQLSIQLVPLQEQLGTMLREQTHMVQSVQQTVQQSLQSLQSEQRMAMKPAQSLDVPMQRMCENLATQLHNQSEQLTAQLSEQLTAQLHGQSEKHTAQLTAQLHAQSEKHTAQLTSQLHGQSEKHTAQLQAQLHSQFQEHISQFFSREEQRDMKMTDMMQDFFRQQFKSSQDFFQQQFQQFQQQHKQVQHQQRQVHQQQQQVKAELEQGHLRPESAPPFRSPAMEQTSPAFDPRFMEQHALAMQQQTQQAMQQQTQQIQQMQQQQQANFAAANNELFRGIEGRLGRFEQGMEGRLSRIEQLGETTLQGMQQGMQRLDFKVEALPQELQQGMQRLDFKVESLPQECSNRLTEMTNRHTVEINNRLAEFTRMQQECTAKLTMAIEQQTPGPNGWDPTPNTLPPLSEERFKAFHDSFRRDFGQMIQANYDSLKQDMGQLVGNAINQVSQVSHASQSPPDSGLKRDISQIVGNAMNQVETAIRGAVNTTEERMVDIRRMNMMVMDSITGIQERTVQVSEQCNAKMTSLEALHPERICRAVVDKVEESLLGPDMMSHGFDGASQGSIAAKIAELCQTIDNAAERMMSAAQSGTHQYGDGHQVHDDVMRDNMKSDLSKVSEQLDEMNVQLAQILTGVSPEGPLGGQITQMAGKVGEGMQKFEYAMGRIMKTMGSGGPGGPKGPGGSAGGAGESGGGSSATRTKTGGSMGSQQRGDQ